jgi:hypothetical protein
MKYSGACLDLRFESGRGNKGIDLTVSRELHNLCCSLKINWLGKYRGKQEMGRTCSSPGREDKSMRNFRHKTLQKENSWNS